MIEYTTAIKKFEKQGEKTGWTYIEVPAVIADQLKPENKKSFRVKGWLDEHPIAQVAILPVGEGDFIMPLNAAMRKGIGKRKGAVVTVSLAIDKTEYLLNSFLMECLYDEPAALAFFTAQAPSHQRYFSKWIDDAKTEATSTKRIALAVSALAKKMDFGSMLRSQKKDQAQ